MSWHSIAGSSFTSDFSFHRFEETNESCTATDSAAEGRPLGPSMSDRREEQLSARSDAASSRRQGKKRPREVSEKRLLSEAGGRKHDVTSKQHNEEARRSFQVISEKISHDTTRPKGGSTIDLRMSDADMNDLRFEALTSRINKVESYLEEIVHHITVNDSRHVTVSPPKKRKVERPKGGSTIDLRMSDADMNDLRFEALTSRINKVESYLEEIVHHITVNDSRHVTVSPPKKRKVERPLKLRLGLGPLPQLVVQNRTYKLRTQMMTQFPFWWMKISVIKKSKTLVMKPRITHSIFLILNQIRRGSLLPMKQSKNLSADTSPLLSPVMEETLYRRSVAFLLLRISWFRR